jgi:hypothetical protein
MLRNPDAVANTPRAPRPEVAGYRLTAIARIFLRACQSMVLVLTVWLAAAAASFPAHATTFGSPPVDFNHLPWKNGESLTYLVSMGLFDAAEGTFTAQDKGDHWEFHLKLASRGFVDEFYPFSGYFWCVLGPGQPWRSVEYGEYRFEPKRIIKEQTRIDYAAGKGTRAIWTDGKSKRFSVAEDAIDDVGTMLYHLRTGAWKPGDHRLIHVYESDSEKEAVVECEARETRAFGSWPAQPVLRIVALPGKGTHHRGRLTMWITDDARHLPLHADLEFRYGTFGIDLESAK